MRNTILYIIGLTICICSIVMLFLVSFKQNSFAPENLIIIDGKMPTTEILEMPSINVNPGTTSKYSFYLSFLNDGQYNINFSFKEKIENILKDYINVKLKINNEILFEEKLKDICNGDTTLSFIKEVNKDRPLLVEILYEVPISVGNEIQGLKTSFELKLYVKKEGI